MSGWLRDYTVVFKGGPNHGIILRGQGAQIALLPKEGQDGPAGGDSILIGPFWAFTSWNSVGPDEAQRIWDKVGIPGPDMDKYTIESIEGDFIVYRHTPKG